MKIIHLKDLQNLIEKIEKYRKRKNIDPKIVKKIESDLEKLGEDDLDKVHAAHIETMNDQINDLYTSLPENHPIKTLALEHEEMLYLLDELEKLNSTVQGSKKLTDLDQKTKESLKITAKKFKETVSHDKREEVVIFEELKEMESFYKLKIMAEEHKSIRDFQDKLLDLIDIEMKNDFEKFKKNLGILTKILNDKMRYHIYKENNIIYPSVLDLIKKAKDWGKIKAKCDEIGYGCFSQNCDLHLE